MTDDTTKLRCVLALGHEGPHEFYGFRQALVGCETWVRPEDVVMPSRPIADQPPPMVNANPAIWPLVIADVGILGAPGICALVQKDMEERHQVGIERYGTPLQPFNGRDALVDAYQEALDKTVYLRQALLESSQMYEPTGEFYVRLTLLYNVAYQQVGEIRTLILSRERHKQSAQ